MFRAGSDSSPRKATMRRRIVKKLRGSSRCFVLLLSVLGAVYFLAPFWIGTASRVSSVFIIPEPPALDVMPSLLEANGNLTADESGEAYTSSSGADQIVECSAMVCNKRALPLFVQPLRHLESNGTQFCVSGNGSFHLPTAPKSVSAVIIRETDFQVENVSHFDVSVDDKELRDFLMRQPYHRLLLLSSTGNVTDKIKPETISALHFRYGGPNVLLTQPFDSMVFVGQKGLEEGRATLKRGGLDIGDDILIRGCLRVPMGKLNASALFAPPATSSPWRSGFSRTEFVDFKYLPECIPAKSCDENDVALSIYSGISKDDHAKICVNGRTVITDKVNGGGRGLNVVLFNATSKEVTGVGRFDTYEDSALLEAFFNEIKEGEVIIVVTSDEASKQLSSAAKYEFHELGSTLIWNVKFRSSWYLIGQKGMLGFSPYEELNHVLNNDWASPVNKNLCFSPSSFSLLSQHIPKSSHRNSAKRRFCSRYDGYEDFCEETYLDEFITPARLQNRSLVANQIFKVPILVVAGLSKNSLRVTLETVISQPGINPDLVLVCYNEYYGESAELAHLFHFRSKPLPASSSHPVQLARSLELVWSEYPTASVAIVIEEDLRLAPDFLQFMSQMLPILEKDKTISAVSAWNVNGFSDASSLPNAAYRVEEFPGLAFMIRKETYEKHMKGRMDECCLTRAWDGWHLNTTSVPRQQMLIPDVSRVSRRHVHTFDGLVESAEEYFHRQRSLSSGKNPWISNVQSLSSKQAYDASVQSLINASIRLDLIKVLEACKKTYIPTEVWTRIVPAATPKPERSFVLYFDNKQDPSLLARLRRCFGLYYRSPSNRSSWTRRGFYKGVLRFSIYGGGSVFLVAREAPFYQKLLNV